MCAHTGKRFVLRPDTDTKMKRRDIASCDLLTQTKQLMYCVWNLDSSCLLIT